MFAVQKGKRNEFHVEERRIRRLVKNLYLNLLIVLMFYGLFHLLFREHPQYGIWIRWVLMIIFLLAGILVLLADIRAIGRAQRICCRLQEGGWSILTGKKAIFIPGPPSGRWYGIRTGFPSPIPAASARMQAPFTCTVGWGIRKHSSR